MIYQWPYDCWLGKVGSSFSNLIWKSLVCRHFKPEIAPLVGIRPTDWRDFAIGVYYYYYYNYSSSLPRDRRRKIACAGRETDNHAFGVYLQTDFRRRRRRLRRTRTIDRQKPSGNFRRRPAGVDTLNNLRRRRRQTNRT